MHSVVFLIQLCQRSRSFVIVTCPCADTDTCQASSLEGTRTTRPTRLLRFRTTRRSCVTSKSAFSSRATHTWPTRLDYGLEMRSRQWVSMSDTSCRQCPRRNVRCRLSGQRNPYDIVIESGIAGISGTGAVHGYVLFFRTTRRPRSCQVRRTRIDTSCNSALSASLSWTGRPLCR